MKKQSQPLFDVDAFIADRRQDPAPTGMNRRDFFKISAAVTGGLMIALHLPGCGPVPRGEPFTANVFATVHTDDWVEVTISKSDMGQDVRTSLARILADEIGADWEKIAIQQASFSPDYGRQGTGGSSSIRTMYGPLRQAGATARAMLVSAAIQQWGEDFNAEDCYTKDAEVIHRPSGKKIAFGKLVATAATLTAPEDAPLKDPEEFYLIGKAAKRLDAPDIVQGKATFGIDKKIPDMRYAAVERCPIYGGKVKRFDASAALAVPGVEQVVEVAEVGRPVFVKSGVAVVANNTWAAMQGRAALDIEWEEGNRADHSSAGYEQQMIALTERRGEEVARTGEPNRLINGQDDVIESAYYFPFLAHSPMEPMNYTAHVQGDQCELWGPTQDPGWAARAAADALEIPMENVTSHVTLLGGGFGRRSFPDVATEAALISRAAGDLPVKVVWAREDDMRKDFYRPTTYHRMAATLGDDGFPAAIRCRVASTSIMASLRGEEGNNLHTAELGGLVDMPYRIPNQVCEFVNIPSDVTRGWWRSVEHTHTAFALESFIDELAHRAGRDPYEYRMELIDMSQTPEGAFDFDPNRLKGVLQLAAEKSNWGSPMPEGKGRGIAAVFAFRSYAAEVVEVSVDDQGGLTVDRVVAALDCGRVMNPDGAAAQVESAVIDGLSSALNGEITLENGRIVQSNFHDYPLLRMNQAPKVIESHFVASTAEPSGLGEPPLPPLAPALANAIFDATGKRFYRLPYRAENLMDVA